MADVKIIIGGDAAGATAAAKQAETGLNRVAAAGQVSAGQTAAAWRSLPAQLTDVVTQLQGGASPVTVLLQQGGQIKDQFGGIAATVEQFASKITPAGIAAGAVAATVGTLAYALYESDKAATALQRSLVLTGNAAGVTADSVDRMARSTAAGSQVTIGMARDLTAAAVATGAFGQQSIGAVVAAMATLQSISGAAAETIVADFAGMSRGVAAWAAEHNRQYAFLTKAEFEHIRMLEQQGRSEEAMRETADKLNGELQARRQQLGYLERAWATLKGVASGAWDAMLGTGRPKSIGDQIAAVQADIAEAEGRIADAKNAPVKVAGLGLEERDLAALKQKLEILREQQRLERRAADSKAEAAAKSKQAINDIQSGAADRLANADIDKEIADARTKLAKGLGEIDKEQAAADALYKLGLTSLQQYEEQRIQLAQRALEQRLEEARFEETEEKKRPGASAADVAAKGAKVAAIEGQIAAARIATAKDVAASRASIAAGEVQTAQDYARQWADAWLKAEQTIQSLRQDTLTARTALIQDPNRRAEAEAGQQIAELQRKRRDEVIGAQSQIDMLRNRADMAQKLGQEGAGNPQATKLAAQLSEEADVLQQKLDDLLAAYSDRIGAVNDTLADRLKPGWQKLIDGWKDTNALMRDTYASTMDGVVKNGEDAFVELATSGKLSTRNLVNGILAEFARMQYRQLVASAASGNLWSSIVSLFTGPSYSTGGMGTGQMGNGLSLVDQGLGGGRAEGGSVLAGSRYLVGERGPELLDLASGGGGRVWPNRALTQVASGGASSVNVSMPTTLYIDARSDQAQIAGMVAQMQDQREKRLWATLRAQRVVR